MSLAAHPLAEMAVSEQSSPAPRGKPPKNRVLIAKADATATPEPR